MLIKLRFRFPEVLLGILLAVAIFAMGMLFASSPSFQVNSSAPAHNAEQQAPAKAGENNEKTQSLWVPTDSVGLYTLVLAVFTGLLVCVSSVQGYFLVRADRTARMAAEAAKKSADHIPNVERSYVFFASVTCDRLKDPMGLALPVVYTFKNSGRTPAILRRIPIGIEYMEEGVPTAERFTYGNAPLPAPLILGSDSAPPKNNEVQLFITRPDYERAEVGIGRIFFWGVIEYFDVFGASHETAICSEWHFGQSRFVISTDCPNLNYQT